MTKQQEKILQQRWLEYVEQQADNIELSWQQVQPTHSRRAWWLATAAALIVGVSYFSWYTRQPSVELPQSQTTPPMLLADNYNLTVVDKRIQQALLRGADDETLAQLWQQRAQLAQ